MNDNQVIEYIEKLVAEEEELHLKGSSLTDEEVKKLHKIKIELDRYWDFLRQRRSLRNAGENPNDAEIRSARVVENYKQ